MTEESLILEGELCY